MTSGAKLFYGITVFLAVMLVMYTVGTAFLDESSRLQGVEWAGVAGLTMSTLLALMLAVYLHLTDNKTDISPMDWEEAEIEDGAGVLGFFSASSIWPAAMTGGIALIAYGIAFWHIWLILGGAVVLVWATTKMNLQYSEPPEKH